MKVIKDERILVRIPGGLKALILKDADNSGWGLSDQVRYELMVSRGLWREPAFPKRTKPKTT